MLGSGVGTFGIIDVFRWQGDLLRQIRLQITGRARLHLIGR